MINGDLRLAVMLLLNAYDLGEIDGGSVRWENLDCAVEIGRRWLRLLPCRANIGSEPCPNLSEHVHEGVPVCAECWAEILELEQAEG